MKEKILYILLIIIVICFLINIYILIDFHNDYICSTGGNPRWFDIFDCFKYFNN